MRHEPGKSSFAVVATPMRLGLTLLAVGWLTGSPTRADNATCATCHKSQAADYERSVHRAMDCQECHGGAKKYDLPADRIAALTEPDLSGGVTGRFDHGGSFKGKPSRAEVPQLCGGCHANVERMNPYGLRTDQLARYLTSGHGKALTQKGETRVAVCIDCHGNHGILSGNDPESRTHATNIPETCATCHADPKLMGDFGLPVQIIDEYRQSVHGRLLFEQGDTGSPTCATCHGNHSAMPPGFATVGAVCGRCHHAAAEYFSTSVHSSLEGFRGCVQCHGGGEGRHFHLIERITKPSGVMIQRYAHLLKSTPTPTPEQVTEAIHPDPKQIINRALPTCLDCHDDLDEDESLPKLFKLMDEILAAERKYVVTANRLEKTSQGVLLVEAQQFEFQDAKTHLIELAPLQHTLDNTKVAAKVAELNGVCDKVNSELDGLERGLSIRRRALVPVWIFAVLFAIALYVKFKRLKKRYVTPLPRDWYK